ncbi:MAG: hypothetical protein JWN73_4677 [Betaproteobacteria bacterium]|nr:hypothetical protein [Betaproteobacteria bacterium]
MDTQLTFRQERFVFEYLKDQNASAAAARAGYTAKNLAAQGSELMSNPAVRDRVRMEMQGMLSELRCSAVELMKQRMRAAFFDAGKLLRGWEPIALEELDEETRRAVEVSTIMRKSGPEVRVKQPDRNRALRALEKVLERLERLNAQCYAQLERAGEIPSLEELERMAEEDDARAVAEKSASGISEKRPEVSRPAEPQAMPGPAMGMATMFLLYPEKARAMMGWEAKPGETPAATVSVEAQVLSGSPQMAEAGCALISEQRPERSPLGGPKVLSGSRAAKAGGGARKRSLVVRARSAAVAEKPQVMSGSPQPARRSLLGTAWSALTRKRGQAPAQGMRAPLQ